MTKKLPDFFVDVERELSRTSRHIEKLIDGARIRDLDDTTALLQAAKQKVDEARCEVIMARQHVSGPT